MKSDDSTNLRRRGLDLYLKPGQKRDLEEGLTIENEGDKAVRVRIYETQPSNNSESVKGRCYDNKKPNK